MFIKKRKTKKYINTLVDRYARVKPLNILQELRNKEQVKLGVLSVKESGPQHKNARFFQNYLTQKKGKSVPTSRVKNREKIHDLVKVPGMESEMILVRKQNMLENNLAIFLKIFLGVEKISIVFINRG